MLLSTFSDIHQIFRNVIFFNCWCNLLKKWLSWVINQRTCNWIIFSPFLCVIQWKDIASLWTVYMPSTHCHYYFFGRLGIKACLVMSPLLRITWLFGLLTPLHKAFIYIFTFLNSAQVNYLCQFKQFSCICTPKGIFNGLVETSAFPTNV